MNSLKFSLDRSISIANITIVLLSFTYLFGYLIVHTFTGTIGLPTKSLIGTDYLEAGLFFEILSLAVISVPLILWLLLRGLNKPENLPQQDNGDNNAEDTNDLSSFSNIKLSLVLVTNLFYVMLFFTIFATNESLSLKINWFGWVFSLSFLFFSYLFESVIIFLMLGLTRHALREKCGTTTKSILKGLRFILLVILITTTIVIDLTLILKVPFFRKVLVSASIYLSMLILLCCILSYAIFRIRYLQDNIIRTLMISIVIFFSALLIYFSVITYGISLYPNMPENRGGRYPLTQVTFVIDKKYAVTHEELLDKMHPTEKTIPLFLLDIQNDLFFCSISHAPFKKWNKKIYVINKNHVVKMDLTRNSSLDKLVEQISK